jgi:hypothetical protein
VVLEWVLYAGVSCGSHIGRWLVASVAECVTLWPIVCLHGDQISFDVVFECVQMFYALSKKENVTEPNIRSMDKVILMRCDVRYDI